MKRAALNFAIDTLTFLVMLSMVTTGLLLRFVLVPGSGERRSLWGCTRHEWGDVHFWLAVTLGALVLTHLALHWSWVCGVVQGWLPRARGPVQRSSGRQNLAGAALLVVVAAFVGGVLWVAGRSVIDTGDGGGRQHRRGQRAGIVTPAAEAAQPPAGSSLRPIEPIEAASDGIRVYYFHRTLRCRTCRTIEALARAAVEEQFADALAEGRVSWQAVNLDLPGNEHFERDFELQMQSLVLAEFVGGNCHRFRNLSEIWELVDDEAAFTQYVCRELMEFGGG